MSRLLALLLMLDGKLALVLGQRYLKFWMSILPGAVGEMLGGMTALPSMAIRLFGAGEIGLGLLVLLRRRRDARAAQT